LKSVHIGSGDQLASNKIAIGAFFLLKELEREAEHSPQSNAEFKNCVCVVCVCVCVCVVCVCGVSAKSIILKLDTNMSTD